MRNDKSLRVPGESAMERVEEHFTARFFYAGGAVVSCFFMIVCVWWDWLPDRSISPWRLTFVGFATCVIFGAFAYLGLRRAVPLIKGARGERNAAEVLHEIASWGYRVFHDLRFERGGTEWNVDHVMVGPSGVYVFETKHWVRTGGEGRAIDAGGSAVRAAAEQAERNARDVEWLLRERLGERVRARAVVLLPGRMVHERPGSAVWVLNPKRLYAWVRREERCGACLGAMEVRRIAGTLDAAARGVVSL